MYREWTVRKTLWFIYRNDFPFTSRNPQETVPVSNNPIRSQSIFTEHWLISPCLRHGTDKPNVYGERQWTHVSFWFKVILCWKTIPWVLYMVKLLDG